VSDRKRWFRVADSILRDELTRDQRSTFLGLLAWFNQRRARDGCSAEAACRAVIPKGDLITITLGDDLTTARSLLADVRKRFQLTIRVRGDYTEVYWPKVADFQDWDTPAKPRPSPGRAPAERLSESDPIRSDPNREERERPDLKPAGEAPSDPSPVQEPKPKKSLPEERFDPLRLARYGLDTLPAATARDLLAVCPRGAPETPETLATWFAWIAPRMKLKGYKNLSATARNWWPNLKREDVEKARDWLQIRRIEAQRAEEAARPVMRPSEAEIDSLESIFAEHGL